MVAAYNAFDEQSGIANSAIIVKQNGRDIRILKAPPGELRGYPVVWDGRDEQGNPVPLGDYQLLFYTANHAGLFGSYTAAFRVVDALPVGGVAPTSAPLAPIEPPDDAPWLMTPDPSPPTLPAPMAAAIDRMTGGQSQAGQSQGADTSLAALSKLAGARAGHSASSTGSAGLGTAALLVLAASYLVAQQANSKLDLGKQFAGLSAAWKPSAKPVAPPVPKVAPPVAPPPPPPSKPRPKPLRWNQIRHTPPTPPPPPPPPPKPVWYPPPPKPKPSTSSWCPYYSNPWPAKPKSSSYDYYANPWPAPLPKPSTPSYTYYANPWPAKPPVVPPVPASKPGKTSKAQASKPSGNGLVNSLLGAIGIGSSKPSTPPKAQTTKPGGGVVSSILGAFGIGASKPGGSATTQKLGLGGSNGGHVLGSIGGGRNKADPDPWEWLKKAWNNVTSAVSTLVGNVGQSIKNLFPQGSTTSRQATPTATPVATGTTTPTQTPISTQASTTVPVATVIPTSDYNSVLQEQYGTHVDLTAISNEQQQDEVLRTIFESVNLVGEQTSAAFGNGMSSPQAFEQFFGPKHQITVTNGKPTQCNGRFGEVAACNQGQLSTGAQIYADVKALTQPTEVNGRPISPHSLLIHEFSHTFTNPSATQPGITDEMQFNGERGIYSFVHFDGNPFNNSAANAADALLRDSSISEQVCGAGAYAWEQLAEPSTAEITADVIAGWIINGSSNMPTVVNTFIEQLINHRATP